MRGGRFVIAIALLLVVVLPAHADVSRFVRLSRSATREPQSLDTSIVTYVLPSGAMVSLVAAVHVGEAQYYDGLNKRFQQLDAVLYELITDAEDGRPPGRESRGGNPVSIMQRVVRDALRLRFQLEAIDYRAPNFIHADLTIDEFSRSMEKRGESFVQLFIRAVVASQAEPGKGPAPMDLNNVLLLAFSQSRAVALRRIMAEQLKDMGAVLDAINGPEGSTIINERNRRALDVLDKQLQLGKRKLAIFYGGAHMPDMESQLIQRFGAKESEAEWVKAWGLYSVPQ